eukprot:m.241709 g.241709  ORF g.241709 m.241709 type:complete len:741 (+) comp19004_c0_seq2:1488-3710(+)
MQVHPLLALLASVTTVTSLFMVFTVDQMNLPGPPPQSFDKQRDELGTAGQLLLHNEELEASNEELLDKVRRLERQLSARDEEMDELRADAEQARADHEEAQRDHREQILALQQQQQQQYDNAAWDGSRSQGQANPESSCTNVDIGNSFHATNAREVLDWEAIDSKFVYSYKRYWQVMKHVGATKIELKQVVESARKILEKEGPEYKYYNWEHGRMRLNPLRGIEYSLDFAYHTKLGEGRYAISRKYRRVEILRPFADKLVLMDNAQPDIFQRPLYMIIPLSGRANMFSVFMESLKTSALFRRHPPLHVTVVYFHDGSKQSDSAKKTVRDILHKFEKLYRLVWRLITRQDTFSRGAALEAGANAIRKSTYDKGKDAVMLFVDVDMKMSSNFFYRCRANPIAGKRAYFPIVFSQYHNQPPTVHHNHGAWRNYGLGMACMYVSDFIKLGGFSKKISGWGKEDVDLYDRLVKQGKIEVIRAIDQGLIHKWHPKHCDRATLTSGQYDDCLGSMADWEGSKKTLGIEAMKLRTKSEALEKQVATLRDQLKIPNKDIFSLYDGQHAKAAEGEDNQSEVEHDGQDNGDELPPPPPDSGPFPNDSEHEMEGNLDEEAPDDVPYDEEDDDDGDGNGDAQQAMQRLPQHPLGGINDEEADAPDEAPEPADPARPQSPEEAEQDPNEEAPDSAPYEEDEQDDAKAPSDARGSDERRLLLGEGNVVELRRARRAPLIVSDAAAGANEDDDDVS